jgi:hypothetical protein
MQKSPAIVSASEMVAAAFGATAGAVVGEHAALVEAWAATLKGLKKTAAASDDADARSETAATYGENLLSHCAVKSLKNGLVTVETDHPGWAQLLSYHRTYILAGLSKRLSGAAITAIAFKAR